MEIQVPTFFFNQIWEQSPSSYKTISQRVLRQMATAREILFDHAEWCIIYPIIERASVWLPLLPIWMSGEQMCARCELREATSTKLWYKDRKQLLAYNALSIESVTVLREILASLLCRTENWHDNTNRRNRESIHRAKHPFRKDRVKSFTHDSPVWNVFMHIIYAYSHLDLPICCKGQDVSTLWEA